MQTMDPGITAAYEACRRLQRRHDPTYYWATRRLPAAVQPATHALYGYVRTADQIVDGPHRPPTPAARRAALDAWEEELRRGLAGDASPHPVVGALVDAGERHDLPLGELGIYMQSMRADCGPVRIESWDELDAYMDGSAGSVGRIMAPLLGVPERYHADFGRLGQAFQLANFIRDVARGLGDGPDLPAGPRGRGPHARDPGATPGRRPAGRPGPRRCSPSRSPPSPPRRPSVRSGVRLACAAYARILDRVEAVGRRRARPPRRRARPRRAGDPRGRAAMTRRATLRGSERTPLDDARRRADLRGELRRPGRRPRAGRQRRRRARRRPLRDRRARDVRVRRADAVAARDGRRALDPPGARVHGLPHAARLGALPAAVELVELRLPRAVRGALRADRRPLRDRQGPRRGQGRRSTPTAAT